jgi:hypothetical protein
MSIAVVGNLLCLGVTVALFVVTVTLQKRR